MGGIISNISAWLSSFSLSDAIAFLTALVTAVALLNRLLRASIRTVELVTKLVNTLLRLWRPRDQRKPTTNDA